jgi:phage-related protein
MSFYAKSFIFDGVPSEYYDMRVFSFEGGGLINSPAGSDIEIFSKSVYRRPKTYLYGSSQRPVLTFPLVFGSFTQVDGETRSAIEKWLFGHSVYKILSIEQCDMDGFYYNCLLTSPKSIFIGNLNYAYSCEVSCDSPWMWEYPKTLTKTYSGSVVTDETFTFFNNSANNDYLYPSCTFALNGIGTSFTLINESDNNRAFTFTDLLAGETMTIDNDRKILSSSTGLYRLAKFNLNWLRLLPGANVLHLTGAISSFTMTTQLAKKAGG